MILEVALLNMKAGEGRNFEQAFPQAQKVLVEHYEAFTGSRV